MSIDDMVAILAVLVLAPLVSPAITFTLCVVMVLVAEAFLRLIQGPTYEEMKKTVESRNDLLYGRSRDERRPH